MSYPYADEDDKPGPDAAASVPMAPATGKHRALLAIVIILGILIVLAFGALIMGLIVGTGGRSTASSTPWQAEIDVPPGGRVASWQVEGGRAVVHLVLPGREEIVLIDVSTGKVIGRVEVKPSR